jgi:hypothetical protein
MERESRKDNKIAERERRLETVLFGGELKIR